MPKYNIEQLLRDHNVPHVTEGHKHCQPGWIQVRCPYCKGNEGWHLGYNFQSNTWNCWRCGKHTMEEVLFTFLKIHYKQVKDFLKPYRTFSHNTTEQEERIAPTVTDYPMGTTELKSMHKKYLKGRGFNSDILAKQYGLLGTGPVGNYKFRVIVPIFENKRLVSFQGRDITDRQELKYKACAKDLEAVHHKNCLYNIDAARGDAVIIVEGVTDVWRLGAGAVAVFGIKFTHSQVIKLARFSKRIILFDAEEQAQRQAEKLANMLCGFGGDTYIETLKSGDPAKLSDKAAKKLMEELLR